jgi:preprotein translocase subunit Sss1
MNGAGPCKICRRRKFRSYRTVATAKHTRHRFSVLPSGALLIGESTRKDRGWYAMSVETKQATDPSISELMSPLSLQVSRLIRDEMRPAEKEFQESAKHAGIGAGLFSVAGLLAFFGGAAVIPAAVAALSLVLALWAAAVIVGAVLFVATGIAALVGRSQAIEVTPAAPRTVETVKADIQELTDARRGTT